MRVHAIVEDVDTARRAIEAGATVIQLRLKAPTADVVARGRGLRGLGTTFVVNDDVDAALELGADGVHLGQSDGGAERARQRGLLLGRSATSYDEAVAAEADYLGVGPIWETPSKADATPPLGLDGARAHLRGGHRAGRGDRRHRRLECGRLHRGGRGGRRGDSRGDRSGAPEGGG